MSYSVKLPVGSLGIVAEPIHKDKWGDAFIHYIPEVPGTKATIGTHKVQALEDIRAQRDIIIVSANNGAIEHTPQELKYMTRAETWQRVDEDHPLPMTANSRPATHTPITVTAAGNTLLRTPASGKRIRLVWYKISNAHGANVDVGMRFGVAGTISHRTFLVAAGGNTQHNLSGAPWQGAINEQLFAWAAGAYVGGVYFSIAYHEED